MGKYGGFTYFIETFLWIDKDIKWRKYSTLVVAFPLLRMVKSILSNRNMFIGQGEDIHMKKQIQIFREKYEEEDF